MTPKPWKPTFTKADDQTAKRIMAKLGESGPRGLALWLACIRLAKEAWARESQPIVELRNWGFFASEAGLKLRTIHRLRPKLERIGVLRFVSGPPLAVQVLQGFWPNGANSVEDTGTSPPAPAPGPARQNQADCPPRLRPAFDALMATGKMPTLTPEILHRVADGHPKARFLKRITEVAERLAAIDGRITDPGAWLEYRAREMERANIQPPDRTAGNTHTSRSISDHPGYRLWFEIKRIGLAPSFDASEGLRYALEDFSDLPSVADSMPIYLTAAERIKAEDLSPTRWPYRFLEAVREGATSAQ